MIGKLPTFTDKNERFFFEIIVHEVKSQAEFALEAWNRFTEILHSRDFNASYVFAAAHQMLSHAANISKLIDSPNPRKNVAHA